MSTESETTRWWENYLVRYLMPSIAGVAIVNWLCSRGGDALRAILLLPPGGTRLDTTTLILVFLYGNLFCYIASYPVLVFHVTRVTDFSDGKWRRRPLSDGYVAALALTILAFSLFHLGSAEWRFWIAFLLAVLLVAVQLRRLYLVLSPRIAVQGLSGTVSAAFGFAYALARRRGIPEEIKTTGSPASASGPGGSPDIDNNDEVTTRIQIKWRPEFIATYRHLREHGNSAFIFLFELALAALVSCVIAKPGQSPTQQLGAQSALSSPSGPSLLFSYISSGSIWNGGFRDSMRGSDWPRPERERLWAPNTDKRTALPPATLACPRAISPLRPPTAPK